LRRRPFLLSASHLTHVVKSRVAPQEASKKTDSKAPAKKADAKAPAKKAEAKKPAKKVAKKDSPTGTLVLLAR
jgi:hypothetical protein